MAYPEKKELPLLKRKAPILAAVATASELFVPVIALGELQRSISLSMAESCFCATL